MGETLATESSWVSFFGDFLIGFAFLLGSIPFGPLVARIFKVKDLVQKGSGNIGATNVSRVLGFWPAGVLTFCLDVGKGVLAVSLGTPLGCAFFTFLVRTFVAGAPASELDHFQLSAFVMWTIGLFAVLGHCYSPWLHFKGGKGVATGFGVMLVLSPLSASVGLLTFLITFYFRRIASLSSIAGLILVGITYLVLNPVGAHLCVGAVMLLVILIRHERNIDALLENRERSFQRAE